jgi:hypothetical protein
MAARLRLRNPDQFTIWPSTQLAAGTIICCDPGAFVSYINPEPLIDAAAHGALVMATPAVPFATGTGPTIGTPIRSLTQTDTIAIRVQLDVAFTMRAAMIAVINGATWG